MRKWLVDLRGLYTLHADEFVGLSRDEIETRLSELNILQQVKNLSNIPIIKNAWKKSDYPKLYGWYFDLYTGLFRELVSMEKNQEILSG
jgi:carbonic anhydrase